MTKLLFPALKLALFSLTLQPHQVGDNMESSLKRVTVVACSINVFLCDKDKQEFF